MKRKGRKRGKRERGREKERERKMKGERKKKEERKMRSNSLSLQKGVVERKERKGIKDRMRRDRRLSFFFFFPWCLSAAYSD